MIFLTQPELIYILNKRFSRKEITEHINRKYFSVMNSRNGFYLDYEKNYSLNTFFSLICKNINSKFHSLLTERHSIEKMAFRIQDHSRT